MQHTQGSQRLVEGVGEVVIGQAEVEGEGAVDVFAQGEGGVVVGQQGVAKAGDVGPLVDAPERFPGDHAGVVFGQVVSDVEGFLAVDERRGLIQRLIALFAPATVVRCIEDRDLGFLGFR